MGIQGEILDQTILALGRPGGGQIHFSDVFPEVDGSDTWWRRTDFDAGLTVAVESAGFPHLERVPIGLRPWLTEYGLVLLDDLVRGRGERLAALPETGLEQLHPDLMREKLEAEGRAVLAVANYAPRDDANTEGGANGSDFYLAITDSGLEIYATPLSFLRGLEARNRITALYRIPTIGHPEFNGEHEQFRSARVVRSRRHPDHLVPEFEYADQSALVAAKHAGEHPQVIGVDARPGHFAFVDKFGNIKLELSDASALGGLVLGGIAILEVSDGGSEHEVPLHVADDLRSAPLGKLVVYANCSDHTDGSSQTGFVELIARVNGNPSTSRETAIFQLLQHIPDLDLASASVKLVA